MPLDQAGFCECYSGVKGGLLKALVFLPTRGASLYVTSRKAPLTAWPAPYPVIQPWRRYHNSQSPMTGVFGPIVLFLEHHHLLESQ